jgi:hypothetical protein
MATKKTCFSVYFGVCTVPPRMDSRIGENCVSCLYSRVKQAPLMGGRSHASHKSFDSNMLRQFLPRRFILVYSVELYRKGGILYLIRRNPFPPRWGPGRQHATSIFIFKCITQPWRIVTYDSSTSFVSPASTSLIILCLSSSSSIC